MNDTPWSVFGRVSAALARNKKTVRIIFVLLLALAAFKFYTLQLDTSVSSLFPDSSAGLAHTGKLMSLNPGSRVIFVEMTAVDSGKTDEMREIAGELKLRLADFLHPEVKSWPDPALLLRFLPFIFDERMEIFLAQKLSHTAVAGRMREIREGLSGPLAFVPKRYLRDDPLGLLEAFSDKFREPGLPQSAFDNGDFLVSEDGRGALLVLFPKSDLNDVYGAKQFVEALRDALDGAVEAGRGISAGFAGALRFTAENAEVIESDLRLTISLSLVFIALIYIFTVRSRGAVWLFLTPVMAVIFSGCALSVLWPATSGLALGFGAAVLGLAEDYAVLVHFALRKNPARQPEVIAALARPMCFSAALCIAAFCVLLLSGIPALRQLGFFAAFSLFCGLAIALFVLPCLPWIDRPYMPGRAGERAFPHSNPLECGLVSVNVLRVKVLPTLLLNLGCLCVCFFGFYKVTFDDSFQHLGANSDKLRREITDLRSRWNNRADPAVWASPGKNLEEALDKACALAEILRKTNPGGEVFSVSDLLPPKQVREANIRRWNNFTATRSAALRRDLREAAADCGFKPDSFGSFLDWFGSGQPPEDMDSAPDILLQAGFAKVLELFLAEREDGFYALTFNTGLNADEKELAGYGVLLSFDAVAREVNQAFAGEKFILPLAGVACILLLAVCFKNFKLILLSTLPPLLGLSSIMLWLLFSGTSLNPAGAAALTLVVGLGSDYGIVMLHELSSKLGLGVFRAIFVSGLTTLAGLGVLVLARHPVLYSLGSITFFGLLAEMCAVLLIVPHLCERVTKT
ncbi:MAG: MMPL family transporter [Deltaproteobacteria bacterium]|jgi:predicted exporter|nr:MMPL family transporter [Deltaproteobacteria bacterium]